MKNVNLPLIFEKIKKIEEIYPVDDIQLHDGTKLWNLIRILFYFYPQKYRHGEREIDLKTIFNFVKENALPIKTPSDIKICGFSGTESRRYGDGKFYDIYMDPLYDIFGENFYVFEWPTPAGYRRKYRGKIYSKNYIAMHIPILSKTFFNIGINKLFGKENFTIISRDILNGIIGFYSNKLHLDKKNLYKKVYSSISVFYNLKKFFINFLRKMMPKAVFIRCGYGRFHMALSQACRELGIPSIELQHGIITRYHAGYVKATASDNRDGVPEYLLTYGDAFSDIVKKGNLFVKNKVVSVGFPYLEEVKESPPMINEKIEEFAKKFSTTILVTSQWTVGDEIKEFVIDLANKIDNNIGILFKPHPRDWRNYDDLKRYKNIFVAGKYDDTYEIFKIVDVHSTAYSTSGLEALAFGKPNIFMNVGKTSIEDIIHVVDNSSSFMASSPNEYIKILEMLIENYDDASNRAKKSAEKFFKPNAKNNIRKFIEDLHILHIG